MPERAGGESTSGPGRLNFEWARVILATLVDDFGLREVQLAPGSRSAPLVLAAHSMPRLTVRVHLDERCAGFFALGYARASRRPAAVVTTSGSAVANLLPAVVEADQSDVPMLLITADRPPELRGFDANQTILQPGLFGARVRFEADLPLPSIDELAGAGPLSMRAAVRTAALSAVGPPAGPAHLNVPFEKPLQPASSGAAGLAARSPADPSPWPGVLRGRPGENAAAHPRPGEPASAQAASKQAASVLAASVQAASTKAASVQGASVQAASTQTASTQGASVRASVARLAPLLAAARRALLVAGPSTDPTREGPAIARFAAARGIPAFADPLSGARFDPSLEVSRATPVLGAYDHFLHVDQVVRRYVPDLVVRVGRSPASPALEAALARWRDSRQVVIDDGAHRKDHQRLARHYLRASASAVLTALTMEPASGPPPPGPWLRAWLALESAVWAALDEPRGIDEWHEGDYARSTLEALPAGATLFASSSMPVRDVAAYARPAPRGIRVLGNRGASGIDGIASTALGCAAGGASPVVALVGDIAFYHDMNGLLATRDRDLNVTFVVVDNDGGGIFHMLPIRDFEPAFTPCFATPHGLDFRHAARLYGLPFADAASPAELGAAVASAARRRGARVIRVRTDRHANRLGHEADRARVARRLRRLLAANQARFGS